MPRVVLEDLNLENARRHLVETALAVGGSIVDAAGLLGVHRIEVKRAIIRLRIEYPLPAERKSALLASAG